MSFKSTLGSVIVCLCTVLATTATVNADTGEGFGRPTMGKALGDDFIGACCQNDVCMVVDGVTCIGSGGVYGGDGTNCDGAIPCFGACCLPDGSCVELSQELCSTTTIAGLYQGPQVACDDATCVPFGACCEPDTSCQLRTAEDCANDGGFYQGDNERCVSSSEFVAVVCEPRGACCLPDGTCAPVLTHDECAAMAGIYQGFRSECGDADYCKGACSMEDGTCIDGVTQNACELDTGSTLNFQGYRSTCDETNPPSHVQCRTLSTDMNTETSIDFLKFDDDDGKRVLQTVKLSVGGQVIARVVLENTGSQEIIAIVDSVQSVDLDIPEFSVTPVNVLDVNEQIECDPILLPVGGSCDFDSPIEYPFAMMESISLPMNLDDFVGPGTLKVDVLGIGSFNFVGSQFVLTQRPHVLQTKVQLTYEYVLRGGCCFEGSPCEDLTRDECAAAGGTYQGEGVLCADTDCPQACCLRDGLCTYVPAAECRLTGMAQGDGTTCEEADCPLTCCLEDGMCLLTSQMSCLQQNGTVQDPGVSCSDMPFPCLVPGACCLPDGACLDGISQSTCVDVEGGDYQGDYTTCNRVFCPVPKGACCLYDGSCTAVTEEVCMRFTPMGDFQGDTSDCSTVDCPQPEGACCLADGSCLPAVTQDICVNVEGGVWQGQDVACTTELCPIPKGQCCLPSGACSVSTASACADLGGDFNGDLSTCVGNQCPPPNGACCAEDGSCSETTQAMCLADGSLYQGNMSTCTEIDCPDPKYACCYTDGSCAVRTASDCEDEDGQTQGDVPSCVSADCPQPDGACCLDDGMCVETTQVDCVTNQSGLYQGNFSLCIRVNCPQPPGACCFPDGTCTIVTEERCENATGGDFQGDNVTCEAANCPPPTGACCLMNGGCLSDQTQADCTGPGEGVYQGNFTTCNDTECPQPPGACCFPDGSCTQVTEERCETAGGIFSEDFRPCAAADCPQPTGACCLEDGSCVETEQEECVGLYQGDDTVCDTTMCPQPKGACCLIDGSCVAATEEECDAIAGGDFRGDGSSCGTVECPMPGACCLENGTCVMSNVVGGADCTGQYQGDGTSCADVSCDGACCLLDGTCVVTDAEGCTAENGEYQGLGTSCGADTCDQPGACCLEDGTCVMSTVLGGGDCDGVYQGDNTTCLTVSCDGACCLLDGTCVVTDAEGCTAENGEYQGLGTSCGPDTCDRPGACCLEDGTCVMSTVLGGGDCDGVYQGDNTTCLTVSCDGACCLLDGTCVVTDAEGCTAENGEYQGLGTSCGPDTCDRPGACCLEDGTCVMSTVLGGGDCDGVYQGDNTTCLTVSCDGACCLLDGTCVVTDAEGCTAENGEYQGLGTSCGPDTCDQPGACCLPDGSCVMSTVLGGSDCDGVYQGDNTTCATVRCPEGCCLTDGSCVELPAGDCMDQGGVPQDQPCGPSVDCPQPGACCLEDGTCVQSSVLGGSDCDGVYQGDNTYCDTTYCPQPGACCLEDGSCVQSLLIDGADCDGEYQGNDTTCAEVECDICIGRVTIDWDLDLCDARGSGPSEDYSEFTADVTGDCTEVDASNVYREQNNHSCTDDRFGEHGRAMCVDIDEPPLPRFIDDSPEAVRLRVTVFGTNGPSSLESLSFWQSAPDMFIYSNWQYDDVSSAGPNNPPRQFGVRITRDGVEVFRQVDIPTTPDWSQVSFEFDANDPNFIVASGGEATFEVELFAYDMEDYPSDDPEAWELDDIQVVVCCREGQPGACCLSDGSCLDDLTLAMCNEAGGIFQGDLTVCESVDCDPTGACCLAPIGPFTCDGDVTEISMIWDGDEPIRVKAWKGNVGSTLLADIDNVQIGDRVTVSGYGGSPNDVYWELFAAGTSSDRGESKFHLSCSDQEMNGAEDCGARQGNGKQNDDGFVNDWLLSGIVTTEQVLDCGAYGGDEGCLELRENECLAIGGEYQGDGTTCADVSCLGQDCCAFGKPVALTFEYTGDDCSGSSGSESQEDCDDYGPLTNRVYIIANDDSNWDDDNNVYFQGLVNIGDSYVVDARMAGDDRLPSNIYIHVLNEEGTRSKQRLKIHTSCSKDLFTGDQFGSALLVDCLGEDELALSGLVTHRITASFDDAEERTSDGWMYRDSSDLELPYSSSEDTNCVGMRFANLAIPQGAQILGAAIQFTVDETDSGYTELFLEGHATNNAGSFTSADFNISNRPRTSAMTEWYPRPWTSSGAAAGTQCTSDLSAVIQEIVDRPGWNPGNAIAIIATGSGDRTAHAADAYNSKGPQLIVTWRIDP